MVGPKIALTFFTGLFQIDFITVASPEIPAITVQSSMLSSTFPKKNPTAHSKGLSSGTTIASATMLLDCSTQEPTGRTQKVRPSMSISMTPAGEVSALIIRHRSSW